LGLWNIEFAPTRPQVNFFHQWALHAELVV
jgi:hypothetical protein